jgi:hypothetical protein
MVFLICDYIVRSYAKINQIYPCYINIIIISDASESQTLIILLFTSICLTDVDLERIMRSLIEEHSIVKLLRCFESRNEHGNGYLANDTALSINPRLPRPVN